MIQVGDLCGHRVSKDMNTYQTDIADDPDMRFNPRSHIFLLPVCSAKADFAVSVENQVQQGLIAKLGRLAVWR